MCLFQVPVSSSRFGWLSNGGEGIPANLNRQRKIYRHCFIVDLQEAVMKVNQQFRFEFGNVCESCRECHSVCEGFGVSVRITCCQFRASGFSICRFLVEHSGDAMFNSREMCSKRTYEFKFCFRNGRFIFSPFHTLALWLCMNSFLSYAPSAALCDGLQLRRCLDIMQNAMYPAHRCFCFKIWGNPTGSCALRMRLTLAIRSLPFHQIF